MKKWYLTVSGALLIAVALFSSCTNNSVDAASVAPITRANIEPGDIQFLTQAVSAGIMEVQMGNLAKIKGLDMMVINMGGMMVSEHSRLNDEIMGLLTRNKIMISQTIQEDDQNQIDALRRKAGNDFDIVYADNMVGDLNIDISAFEKESSNGGDAEIKLFASNTIPMLKTQLYAALAVQKHVTNGQVVKK